MCKLKFKIGCALLMCFGLINANAQSDTLRVSLKQTEKMFLDSNLLLIAAGYNVDANKALIEQAKVWDNPTLVTDQNVYTNNKFFQHGKDPITGQPMGQYFIQFQQLVKTAGKRGKLINMATTNAKMSQLQLNDLMRNLRYDLRSNYFTLMQLIKNKQIAQQSYQQLTVLFKGMTGQFEAGNISQKEYLRIQSLLVSLEKEIADLTTQISDTENSLKTSLQIKGNVFLLPTDDFANVKVGFSGDQEIVAIAKQNNPNYELQKMQLLYQQQNLTYQKALAVPDITFGPEYDHNSNYIPHYVGLGITLPVPVFNRNKGNIKSADYTVKQQQAIAQNADIELQNNISNAYSKLLVVLKVANSDEQNFYNKYTQMFNNVLTSYEHKQISLLEFMDFFDTYKDVQNQHFQSKLNLQLVSEELNYHAGIDVIKK
jgi:cobalt-zinc-cadmium efflux system outer membrane protein